MSESFMMTETDRSLTQLFRYGLIGIASNLTGYSIYILITYLGVEPKKAMTLLYFVGATISFIANRRWTFSHEGGVLGAGTRYVIAHFFGYLLNLFMLFIFVDKLNYAHQWVQAIAIFVVALFLFISFKCFVFSNAESGTKNC